MGLAMDSLSDLQSKLIAFAVACVIMQIIVLIIKRQHRHKTFKRMQIPGPKPHLIHGQLYETRRQAYVKFADKMHEKYGKTVGMFLGGDPFLITKDLDLIQQVFVAKSRIFYDRMNFYLNIDPVPDNLICQRGDRWRYMRKLLTPAFTNSKIRTNQFYRDTQKTIEKFMTQLELNSKLIEYHNKETNTTQMIRETLVEDAYDRMAAVALDVIVKTAFHMDDMISFNGRLSEIKQSSRQIKGGKSKIDILEEQRKTKKTDNQQDAFLNTVKRACRLGFNPLVELIFCFPFLDLPLTFLCNQLYFGSIIQLLFNRLDYLVRRTDSPKINQSKLNKQQQQQKQVNGTMQHDLNRQPQQQIQQRRIIDSLIEVLREKKITKSEFKGNAFVIVFAGFETTANALTFTLWLLVKHEQVQNKLRQELQSQMAKLSQNKRKKNVNDHDDGKKNLNISSIICENKKKIGEKEEQQQQQQQEQEQEQQQADFANKLADSELAELAFGCEYLEMVLNESMRLYPPVPGLSCRQASVDCDLSNGLHIEKGVNVIPSVFSIHRDKSIWGQDAHLFRPERFEALDVNQLNSAMFMPFGLGPRNCIGKAAAIHEMKIVLGRLLLEYKIVNWPGKTPEKLRLCSPVNITITNADKIGLKFIKLSDK